MNPARSPLSRPRNAIRVLAAVALASRLHAADAPATSHSALGVQFDAPVALSAPATIGMDAVALTHPPTATPGSASLELVLARLPADLVQAMAGDHQQLVDYAKTTYMGAAGPAKSRAERLFLNAKAAGEILESSIPKPGRIELYLIPLPDGARLFLAARSHPPTTETDVDRLLSAIARSLVAPAKPAP